MAATRTFSGHKLRELRKRAGVTATDLAFTCGRSEQMVWAWEQGRHKPAPDLLPVIARRLGVDHAELFEDTSNA